MKAIQLAAIHHLELIDAPVPAPGKGQMLIRTRATTICTSDINDLRENPFHIALPVVIGHEGAGTVAALGEGVQGFAVGDRVATSPVHPCGHCAMCRQGLGHLCLEMGHFGINMPGTMAEYYLVGQERACKIPPQVRFETAALAEPVSVCLEALAQARILPGQSLLIIGDGPFGIIMARLAVDAGVGQVVLAGQREFRLSFARPPIQSVFTTGDDPRRLLLSLTKDAGYDAAILAVGSPQALADGLACLKPKGRMVIFSALPGSTPVDLFSVHLKELEIIGACNEQDRFLEAVDLLADPALALGDLVTHTFPLEEYHRAFHLAEHGKDQALKVAFTL